MARNLFAASLYGLAMLTCTTAVVPRSEDEYCSVFHQKPLHKCRPLSDDFSHPGQGIVPPEVDPQILEDAFTALSVLQNTYYEPMAGTWPNSIDWTGAVIGTIVTGMLTTLTRSLESIEKDHDWKEKENLMSSIFAQITHSFYGQNGIGILNQAYDDILWVVLEWLEAIKFARLHATLHHPGREETCLHVPGELGTALGTISWNGYNWVCVFAERSRSFWDAATKGWDTKLCQGGMIWNPRLLPYKNAITNELWISASIAMYEYFPNDTFKESWVLDQGFPTRDPVYLAAAIEGYKWLKGVNMTNQQGLYADGFHVDMRIPGNIECDQRDEMVYTYNQGVILSGQRGLFIVTGSPSYLVEGHKLIRNVIDATGWNLHKDAPADKIPNPGKLPPWRGLGRGGVLEEQCDADGTCSQDGQTFKGIFFHHLTAFCAPVEPVGIPPHENIDQVLLRKIQTSHDKACRAYLGWVKHNMDAALDTRDAEGRFGMWWGASIFHHFDGTSQTDGINHMAPNTTDYRNQGTPLDDIWGLNATWQPGSKTIVQVSKDPVGESAANIRTGETLRMSVPGLQKVLGRSIVKAKDPNDRGRGRTVETQAGGLALLRAYWELSQIQCEAL